MTDRRNRGMPLPKTTAEWKAQLAEKQKGLGNLRDRIASQEKDAPTTSYTGHPLSRDRRNPNKQVVDKAMRDARNPFKKPTKRR